MVILFILWLNAADAVKNGTFADTRLISYNSLYYC